MFLLIINVIIIMFIGFVCSMMFVVVFVSFFFYSLIIRIITIASNCFVGCSLFVCCVCLLCVLMIRLLIVCCVS